MNQAANSSAHDKREIAAYSARNIAVQFELQLALALVPATYLQLLVEQQPYWPYWEQNFDRVATKLLTMVPNGTIWNLQLQPFGQSRGYYPLRPADRIGFDLIGDPSRRGTIYPSIQTKGTVVNILYANQGFYAAFVLVPVFIQGTKVQATMKPSGKTFKGPITQLSTIRSLPCPSLLVLLQLDTLLAMLPCVLSAIMPPT